MSKKHSTSQTRTSGIYHAQSTDLPEQELNVNSPIEFTYTIGTTNIQAKRKIFPLTEDRVHRESINWANEFKISTKLAKWSDEDALQVILSLIPVNLVQSVIVEKDLDATLDKLKQLTIGKYSLTTLINNLKNIFQINYLSIREYLEAIMELINKLAIINKYSKRELENKILESFYAGLHAETLLEIRKAKCVTVQEIMDFIQGQEEILISNASNTSPSTPTFNEKTKSTLPKNSNIVYCSYHKTTTHNSKDCNKLKSLREKTKFGKYNHPDNTPGNNNSVISYKSESLNNAEVLIEGSAQIALVDTGATESFISDSLVNKLNIKRYSIKKEKIVLANSTEEFVNDETRCKFTFFNSEDGTKAYDESFKIVRNLSNNIILGNSFLKANHAIINLTTGCMHLNNYDNTINFLKASIQPSDLDNDLIQRSMLSNLNKQSKDYLLFKNELIKYIKLNKEKTISKCKPVQIRFDKNVNLSSKPYPISNEYYLMLKNKINQLLENGTIVKSNSKTVSPMFIGKKGNNDIRILIDYRKLNKYVYDDNFCFPSIYDNVEMIRGSKYFSKIDLTNSFYQIPIQEECQDVTSFICTFGQYKFTTLPFGLKSSPKIFQRTITNVLEGIKNIIIFVDDLLLFNETAEEHRINLNNTIQRLQDYSLKINFDKSLFFKSSIDYLGMNFDSDGYKADLSRIKNAIKNFIPRTKKGYQKLLGYLGFFRPFVPSMAELLIPITNKIKGIDEPIEKILLSKDKVLEEINKNIKIMFPKIDEKFILNTDSSNTSCGSILTQSHGIVGIFSHKFSDTEFKYNTMEKEFLSILLSLRKFKYLIGNNWSFVTPIIKIY